MGWLGLPLPERCGGLGGSETDLGLLMQELGRHGVVEPFHACAVLAARVLGELAADGQAALLEAIAGGGQRVALAHLEELGVDPFTARHRSLQPPR